MVEADFLTHKIIPHTYDIVEDMRTDSKRFVNRELSWIAFNRRVLEEAANPLVSLMERVRFLSISAKNLDEFITVRISRLRALERAGSAKLSPDGLNPTEQLVLIDDEFRALFRQQQKLWQTLRTEIATAGISFTSPDELYDDDKQVLDEHFINQVFPVLSPLAVDPAHPFPFLPNRGFSLALELTRKKRKKPLLALLPIPSQIDRFVMLPEREGQIRYLPLEDLLLQKISTLFNGYELKSYCSFRVLRDADLALEDEAEDLVREFEVALKRRRRGDVVCLELTKGVSKELRTLIFDNLRIDENTTIEVDGLIGIADLAEIVKRSKNIADQGKVFNSRLPERVQDYNGDLFAAIQHKDMLLHHPYETFDIVVDFLRQAARDPKVVAIKQTLYRTSAQSPIVEALCNAAEAGKSVTALVELKARFDEAANIEQSRRLERAGAHVVYGFVKYKTHAKMSVVVRREYKKLVTYTHFGTGNYHPITARVYSDLSLFTCDAALGRDANKVFNYVGGYAPPEKLENLSISPLNLKEKLEKLIEAETAHARAGRAGHIWLKLNALIEPTLIDALYAASAAGVVIELIVRGICGLRPNVPGLSENIRVKSIIGRFLEHSRIVCFGAGYGLPARRAKVFISSADWMGRNMHARIETLVEVKNDTVKSQILHQIMAANLKDKMQSWVMDGDGNYRRAYHENITENFNCHRFFVDNPSLSGRGSARGDGVSELIHSKD